MSEAALKPTVLVVDDLPENQRVMERLLGDSPIDIVTAGSGEEAFSIALRQPLAMILLDVRMPGMDGYETAQLLSMNKSTRDIPIIFVTARTEDEMDLKHSYECGAVDFLRKPIDPLILKGKIKVFAKMWAQQQALREMNHKLEDARLHAERAAGAKAEFLATMSHEIRTPLNGILGMTSLLAETEMNDEQRDFLETIRFSGNHLLAVINDILDYSKIEADQLVLEDHPFDLKECLDTVMSLARFLVGEKPLELDLQLSEEVPHFITGDDTRLRQVLLNLLSNAIKFTKEGKVTLVVSRVPEEGRLGIHYRVVDHGIGIPENKLENLFTAFSQADTSTTRRYGGTGLGLAICARLVELMGGHLRVISKVGKGSEFFFTVFTREVVGHARRYNRSDLPRIKGKQALIVDHVVANLKTLAIQLQRWGLTVKAFTSEERALATLINGDPYDICFIKHNLPGMGGESLAKAVRRHRSEDALPLIVLDGGGDYAKDFDSESELWAACVEQPLKLSRLYDLLMSILLKDAVMNDHPKDTGGAPGFDHSLSKTVDVSILLAEDNRVNQKLALKLLEKLGYHADVAANGVEALEALRRKHYDLVFMDIQMPEMDGYEATRRILEEWPAERRPKIVAMTANAMAGDREQCLAAGMNDYISKPIHFREVESAIKRWGHRPKEVVSDSES